MSTPNTTTPDMPNRRRLADQIANQLFTARLLDDRVRLIQTHHANLSARPRLHDIFNEAPQIAASGDPDLIRIAYATAAGTPAVIRLHGPSWSLILSAGRPLPDWVLAVHDAYPLHLLPPSKARTGWLQAFDLTADPLAVPELTRMCQRSHTALTPSP
ncbi:hypothetical protein [Jidongwangia harbinensis]|uniref:hypothetical protein n=1 Tax=Jidongwangia harbinensis TaxID=2878561 RepID=UPI001CDA464E|nr:hypothetical protein [Jidongwangia harbinensis]MCA2216353.1 hypothetical protein [Jidongwangia harbinensis]MCA2217088.1 hypothetical protein [Jidongwangia harbinensis]